MTSESKPQKRYLVLIPARGGSKRLPRKNLMEIGGVSLIGRAIEAGCGLGESATVCLSTDSSELAEEGRRYGPYVPFLRPSELSTDSAKSFDVVKHAIDWFAANREKFDALVFLQPTSPLRTSRHVLEAVLQFEQFEAEGIVSVCKVEHPPEWSARLGNDGNMREFGTSLNAQKRSQDFEQRYRLNGAIYIYSIERLLQEEGFFYNEHTYAYEMEQATSVDIDTCDDYLLAQFWAQRIGVYTE